MVKKPYEKPMVSAENVPSGKTFSKTNIIYLDGDVFRMLTKKGFAELFWERLHEARETNPYVTQESIFDMLNKKYYNVMGCARYSCFDSFRIGRDKKR